MTKREREIEASLRQAMNLYGALIAGFALNDTLTLASLTDGLDAISATINKTLEVLRSDPEHASEKLDASTAKIEQILNGTNPATPRTRKKV